MIASTLEALTARGACVTLSDPDVMFPRRRNAVGIALAKSVCKRCPVIAACAKERMSERYGVWAGLSEDERLAIRAQEQALVAA